MRILAQFIALATAACCLGGCLVAESRYLQKVDEADSLSRELGGLKQKQEVLLADNGALKSQLDKLKDDAERLGRENQTLARDKGELEQALKAKSDSLSQNISDLRQKITALEAENRKLRDDIAALHKAREEKVKEVSTLYEQLLRNMKGEIAQGRVIVSELKGRLTVSLESAILFEPGTSEFSNGGMAVLAGMIDTLKGARDKAIRVEGHTDNVPVGGQMKVRYPSNWELSAARAVNVARFLQLAGIDPALLSAAAFGEHRPVSDNGSAEGRARNNRIEIILAARD